MDVCVLSNRQHCTRCFCPVDALLLHANNSNNIKQISSMLTTFSNNNNKTVTRPQLWTMRLRLRLSKQQQSLHATIEFSGNFNGRSRYRRELRTWSHVSCARRSSIREVDCAIAHENRHGWSSRNDIGSIMGSQAIGNRTANSR